VLTTLIYPKSRGTLRLASADPTAAPLIDFQYSPTRPTRGAGEGSEMTREIFGSAAFNGGGEEEIHPGRQLRARSARRDPQSRDVVYHGVGTCRMASTSSPSSTRTSRSARRGAAGLRRLDHAVDHCGNTNAPAS